MISAGKERLKERAEDWVRRLGELGATATVVPGHSAVGGGSLPGETLPTHLVALDCDSPDAVAATLRAGEPPVITRIEGDRLVLDPRTVLPEQEEPLMRVVANAVGQATAQPSL
jgi:L-seryl-tRNA(Ser) seleniumtransferase